MQCHSTWRKMTIKDRLELNSAAEILRGTFGEDSSSPIDVFSIVLQKEDITTVFYPLSKRISGMCYKKENNWLIVINSTQTYGRQRFTLSHELYHLFEQEGFSNVICEGGFSDKKPDEERNADIFASYFLMPDSALKILLLLMV